uniref:Uncharacterized protein n=1 Tax=Trypanosoma congolense (strain IL3000) TaxID=1068625 RepID=G0UQX2_TRYCI|nr:hypothetical protein, unlikely [Trypanosoma congolense IL3000]
MGTSFDWPFFSFPHRASRSINASASHLPTRLAAPLHHFVHVTRAKRFSTRKKQQQQKGSDIFPRSNVHASIHLYLFVCAILREFQHTPIWCRRQVSHMSGGARSAGRVVLIVRGLEGRNRERK